MTVNGNTAPVARTQSVNVGGGCETTLYLSYSHPDSYQPMTFTLLTLPAHGTATLQYPGSYAVTYMPSAGYTGPDSFTWKMNDGLADSNVATVTITVNANTAPVANNQSIESVQGSNYANQYFYLSYTDPDAGQTRTFTILSQPQHGTATPMSTTSNAFTYTPAAGYTGADSFTWKVNDGIADSNVATVSVTVKANTTPVASNQLVDVGQNGALSISLSYTHPDSYQTLTFAVMTSPAHGTATVQTPTSGAVTYIPALGFVGVDTFTWKANDGTSDSNVATVTVTVTGNRAPVANNQSIESVQGSNHANQVFSLSYSDPDVGQTRTFTLVTPPQHGTVAQPYNTTSPYFTYTPAAGYTGADAFTWKVNDGVVDSNVATVSVTVKANTAPTAQDQSVAVVKNGSLNIFLSYSDPDPYQTKTFALVALPAHGTATLPSPTSGMVTYVPATNYTGSDSFAWKVNDGTADSNVATVTITVNPNTAPVANNQSIVVVQGSNQYFTLNYTDPDAGQTWTFTLLTQPQHGTVAQPSGTTSSNFTYTPQAGYTGADAFTWKVNDGTADSNVATVSVTVNPNTPPVANNQSIVVVQGSNHASQYFTLSYTDPDTYQTRTFTLLTQPQHGTVAQPNGTTSNYFTYTPQSGYTGADAFTWKVNDGTADSTVATVSITVKPNTAPQAQNQRVTVLAGQSSGSQALAYVDPDPYQTRTFALVGGPGHGQLTSFANGSFTYMPDAGFTGTDSFTWKVSDKTSTSNTATCTLRVRSLGDPAGALVLIVAEKNVLPEIQAEVNRLKGDLEAQSYTAKIIEGTGVAWSLIKAEYDNAAQWLEGAILIGNIGASSTFADMVYWNMNEYQTSGTITRADIWASRITAYDGDQVVRLKEALNAHHDYRRGRSRLPFTAYRTIHNSYFKDPQYLANLGRVWPNPVEHPCNGDIGDIVEPMTRGGELVYRSSHNAPYLPDGPHQIRFNFISGCNAGTGRGNESVCHYLSTRGGGVIFGVGNTDVTYFGYYAIDQYLTEPVASQVNGGESWGPVLQRLPAGAFRPTMTTYWGDLSLRAKMSAPANQAPVINALGADTTTPMAGSPLTATVQASDPDAAGSDSPYADFEYQVEWFLYGHSKWADGAAPTFVDTSNEVSLTKSRTWAYDRAHFYSIRVDVMDEWRARAWADLYIQVRPDPLSPLRIDCGPSSGFANLSLDRTDSQGRLWLHDQGRPWWVSQSDCMTWYVTAPDRDWRYLSSAAPVAGTEEDALYQTARQVTWTDQPGGYHLPLPAGAYTVRLHFADMWSTGPGRKTDVTIEGTKVLDGFDAYAVAGPKTAVVKEFTATVSDGWLDIVIGRNPASAAEGILNALEVLPAESEVTVTLAAGYTLIAPPLNPAAPLTAEGLAQQINAQVPSPNCTSVIGYKDGAFVTHPVGTALNNFPIEVGKGYFVRCAAAGTWKAKGYRFGVSCALVPLSSGYNLVGLPLEPQPAGKYTAESAGQELNAQGGGATQLIRYDEQTGQFATHPVGTAVSNFTLDLGRGYFVRSTKSSSWTVNR
jgi:hypothetical protein